MKLVNQKVYIVKPGDTLSEIANHFCGNPAIGYDIAEDNGIINAGLIYQGQRIWIREGFLKEEFKGSPNTQPKEEPFRKGQVVHIAQSGILTRPKLTDWVESIDHLIGGCFLIVQDQDQNHSSVLVQDNKKQFYYFDLNESREVVRVQGAIEVCPGRFMVLG